MKPSNVTPPPVGALQAVQQVHEQINKVSILFEPPIFCKYTFLINFIASLSRCPKARWQGPHLQHNPHLNIILTEKVKILLPPTDICLHFHSV